MYNTAGEDRQVGFVELDVAVYNQFAECLECEPNLSTRLGVALCPDCGDLHLATTLCRNLCTMKLDNGDEELREAVK